MKNNAKNLTILVIGFTLGIIVAGGVGIAVAADIQSRTVLYETEANENVTTVEGALNDLYTKAENCGLSSGTCMVSFKEGDNFAEAIKSLYTEDGEQNLYYHDGTGSYGTYEAGDMSYRYAGPSANVNNYVCYGSDADTCPSANLYRIIGIFKDANDKYQVKLIKASAPTTAMLGKDGASYNSGATYYWNNSTNNNTWSQSNLNTVNLNVNYINYLNKINSKWVNYIDNHTWIVGGNTSTKIYGTAGAQNVYANEITTPAASTTYQAAIGLMYVSDYMYGASATFWGNTKGYDDNGNDMRTAKTSNWLALGTTEWTIARQSNDTRYAFNVLSSGYVNNLYYVYNYYCVARPVFYLKSNVYYNGGTGTSTDPYRISG